MSGGVGGVRSGWGAEVRSVGVHGERWMRMRLLLLLKTSTVERGG